MSSQEQPPRPEPRAESHGTHAHRGSPSPLPRRMPAWLTTWLSTGIGARLARGREARRRGLAPWRVAAVGVFVIAGVLFVTSGHAARGLDLRASSVTDLDTVVRQQADRADVLQARVAELGAEVEELGQSVDDARVEELQQQVEQLRGPAGFEPVRGPAVTVTLTDAPDEAFDRLDPSGGVKKESLVVHQQDIQAVANALWLGGAEAMTLQGQRVVSTTGIKCVGNTVVLHGVPYAPPYVITAIGDVDALQAALASSEYIAGYQTYVAAYDLGYEVSTSDEVTMPGYEGSTDLRYATPTEVETARD